MSNNDVTLNSRLGVIPVIESGAPVDRSYTTYQSAIITTAPSCIVFELFDVE